MSDESTLASADISDRSKIMLMASQGIHQGGGPMKKELPTSRAARGIATEKRKNNEEIVTMSRLERWKLSGVIALSDCGLTKLLLNGNLLSDTSIAWDELTSLKHLIVLSLNQNNLASVPPALGALTSLKQLHIANNKLVCIPTEIGLLTDLEVLKAQNNRLKTIPTSIGNCISLVEVDLSCNLLSELPETFGNLRKLKALYLSNNGLKTLPKTLFRLCLQLSILDLHGTEITIDLLRQFEGWESFDKRRRLKHQKQLDFRVDGSGDFDEGADKNW